ncbi:MAG: fibronectin type III-like domain-contianing protein, partial [Rhodoferax sp.]|nr:fibronectin type III-like domain-contianing protein [Rhodoferax sp.]
SVSRPVKELKGFKRIALNPGEKQIVRFDIEPEMLKFHDENMKWILEPGEFAVMIGKSSADKDLLSIPFSIR